MSEEKWYHSRLSRQKAEEMLNVAGIDGSFVVRASETISGAYALSVLFNKTVHTYRVLPTENGMLAVQTLKGVQQRRFLCLNDLILEYYSPHNGLICGLTNPVGVEVLPSSVLNVADKHIRTDALPPTPHEAPTPRGNPPQGVKVMPTDFFSPSSASQPKEKSPTFRDLPPVPTSRETPRPLSKAMPPKVPTPQSKLGGRSKEEELQQKLSGRVTEITALSDHKSQAFISLVSQYVNEGGLAGDAGSVKRGGLQCAQLQTLLAREAATFQSELDKFLLKIGILNQLFDLSSKPQPSHEYNRGEDVDLEAFIRKLADCQTVVKSLNQRACNTIQSSLGIPATKSLHKNDRKYSKRIVPVTEKVFEVKQETALKTYSKQKLKINVSSGKLTIIKADGQMDYHHNKVLQIIKSNRSKNKLAVVLEGNKKKDFVFEQGERETFCQLMQHVRYIMSNLKEPDCVSLFCGSWNMGDAMPPSDISSWFLCSGLGRCLDASLQAIPHDIYVVGTQETGMPDKEWASKVRDTLHELTRTSFHLVANDALWHIKILIFVKEEHKNRISHVRTSTVKTGIANALGNKGAVAVSFQFGGTSFCFVNAHLTSGAEKCARRNQNYHDIMRNLNLGEDRLRTFDLSNRFDHLYFIGDLNYRLEMEIQEILASLKRQDLNILMKVDQLRREKDSNKCFYGFNEEEILFPPTYRYERGTRDTYAYIKVKKTGIKINVPSWCDRVMRKSYPDTHNECHAYGCSEDIMTSDHSPLFSNFKVGVRSQYASNEGISSSSSNQGSITFELVEIILKAPGKCSFYLQFHSLCLTKPVKSRRNSKFSSCENAINHVKVCWGADTVDELRPITSDRAYLVDQHVLVSIRSEDDNEVHAECVLALRSMIGTSAQGFEEKLTRKGEDTGSIRGRMLVKARDVPHSRKDKTYDFIQRDNDGRYQIEEAYADIPESSKAAAIKPVQQQRSVSPNPTPPSLLGMGKVAKQNKVKVPEVAVYGGLGEAENEYADPDAVTRASPHTSPTRGQNPPHSSPTRGPKYEDIDAKKYDPTSKPLGGRIPGAKPPFRAPPRPQISKKPDPKPDPTPSKASSQASNEFDEALAEFENIGKSLNEELNKKMNNDNSSSGNKSEDSPSSVEEFLTRLNLQHYTSDLKEKGWDNIEFLSYITEEDLINCGIYNPNHCRKILERLRTLG